MTELRERMIRAMELRKCSPIPEKGNVGAIGGTAMAMISIE
jgi:hypothetical protein